ncbi:clathrin light chain [Nadsonia fulvescens var. elongata DSM 6958]|uniref:Clathrin light chain n=1 Tax=Nadsonia fulvescens var. elongata DSM 6958 TaxID=857566 RepID=A0A1E3PH75_9ASCO|nr:clathrin light chain [Nadsonia fulvescens var. elongata DSM 6958]
MSSKFPSLEEFDYGQTTASDTHNGFLEADITGADDLVSREKALLGDDANEFETLEQQQPVKQESDEGQSFEEAFPEINQTQPTTQSITATSFEPAVSSGMQGLSLESSKAIQEWKERQQLEIQRRDELSQSRKAEIMEKANKAIDDFYDNYNSKRDDLIEQTRKEEAEFLEARDDSITGTTWDRALKLIDISDVNTKSGFRDKTRFREILLSLKGDTEVPGAAGY